MPRIRSLLIANRGEIAVRIIRTARRLGIRTIAVYSEADAHALHVRMADQSVCVGPPPAADSYLRIDRIIEAAQLTNADAIHPGYGFLSENPDFAKAVESAGILFIGPSAQAIRDMGDKLAAKRLAQSADVPVLPGTENPVMESNTASEVAHKIGFPVLIKAAAGGGGKGMRIVHNEGELAASLERAQSEARSAFGNPAVFIEKYLEAPHHIEIQVFRDTFGNAVYLFERECSIQRRHQKVIEEAPSPLISEELRRRMGEAAVRLAHACNYWGAGTVEFLVDADENFYFLEMNTRLQVEHPVTEMITGHDLVAWQIAVAEGQSLPVPQDQLRLHGHAVELRVYAEDPAYQFLPSTGCLFRYRIPTAPFVRVDTGVEEGDEVSRHYDPLLAKLIVWGMDRDEALQRMEAAIRDYEVGGVKTTLPFGLWAIRHPQFRKGCYTTHFVSAFFSSNELPDWSETTTRRAVALAHHLFQTPKPCYPRIPISSWRHRRYQ